MVTTPTSEASTSTTKSSIGAGCLSSGAELWWSLQDLNLMELALIRFNVMVVLQETPRDY
jgi:hypothetical protein